MNTRYVDKYNSKIFSLILKHVLFLAFLIVFNPTLDDFLVIFNICNLGSHLLYIILLLYYYSIVTRFLVRTVDYNTDITY